MERDAAPEHGVDRAGRDEDHGKEVQRAEIPIREQDAQNHEYPVWKAIAFSRVAQTRTEHTFFAGGGAL